MLCPNCNGETPRGAEFCHHCGWDLPKDNTAGDISSPKKDGVKCPSCGAGNASDALVCSLCGEVFRHESPAQEPGISQEAENSLPDYSGATASGSEKEKQEYEELLRKVNEGIATAPNKARLADLELKLKNNSQGAATLLFDACLMEPRNNAIRKRYQTTFKKEDLIDWGLGKAPVPVWADIPNILRYPVENGNWLGLLLTGIFISVMHYIAIIGLFGFIASIIAAAFIGSHVCLHMRWAANGKITDPPSVDLDFSNLWYMFMGYIAAFFPFIALIIFSAITNSAVVGMISLISFFVGIFILPMCFLVARLFNSVWQGFNYSFIVRSIAIVFGEYFFAVVLIYAIALFYMFALPALITIVPLLGKIFFLFDLVNLYVLTVSSRILGQLYYNNQKRLGWFK